MSEVSDFPQYTNQRSLYSEFLRYGIEDNVAAEADSIYISSKKHMSKKESNAKLLLYECCYQAYSNLHIPIDPLVLSKKFGIKSKKSISIGKKESIMVDPSAFMDEYTECYQLSADEREFIEEMGYILDESQTPARATVVAAAGVIVCLDEISPIWWNKEEKMKLIAKIDRSDSTVAKVVKMLKTRYKDYIKEYWSSR